MMARYFADRKQRGKIDHIKGKLMGVVRGSSQGSLIGPLAYNGRSNDLLFLIISTRDVSNCVDHLSMCSVGNILKEITETFYIVTDKKA